MKSKTIRFLSFLFPLLVRLLHRARLRAGQLVPRRRMERIWWIGLLLQSGPSLLRVQRLD